MHDLTHNGVTRVKRSKPLWTHYNQLSNSSFSISHDKPSNKRTHSRHTHKSGHGGNVDLRDPLNFPANAERALNAIHTICPFFSLIISGKKAFKVQKCASVLTEKVLDFYRTKKSISPPESCKDSDNILVYILRREINKEFTLNNASVVDENSRVSNLVHNNLSSQAFAEGTAQLTSSTTFFDTASTCSHFETSHS